MKKILSFLTLLLCGVINVLAQTSYTWTFDQYCIDHSIAAGGNSNISKSATTNVASSNGLVLQFVTGDNSQSRIYNLSSPASVDETDYNSYLYMGGGGSTYPSGGNLRYFKTNGNISGQGRLTVVYAGTAGGTCYIYNNETASATSAALTTMTAAASTAVSSATIDMGEGAPLVICHGTKSYIYAIIWTPGAVTTYSVTFANANDATGIVPAVMNGLTSGTEITLPQNRAMFKEGYTLTGWNDGSNTYAPGDTYTVTQDVTFTAVYTANSVSLEDHIAPIVIKWQFGQSNGMQSNVSFNGNSGFIVTQAEVNGHSIDVKMAIDASAGKFAPRADQWAQVNATTVFEIPSESGAIFTQSHYDNSVSPVDISVENIPENTINDITSYSVSNDAATAGKYYLEYIQVVLPAKLVAADIDYYGLYLEEEVAIPSGITAYTGMLNGDELLLTQLPNAVIPAETAVLVKATAAGTYTFASSSTGEETIASSLHGVAEATTVASIEAANTGKTCLTLGEKEGVVAFRKPAGTSIAANKVYLLVGSTEAPSIRIIEANNGATNINNLEGVEEAVKFIENGQLFIKKNGKIYNAVGAVVK